MIKAPLLGNGKFLWASSSAISFILLMGFLVIACGERKPDTLPTNEIPVNLQWKQPLLTKANETVTSTGLLLTFDIPTDQPVSSNSPVFAVCLPPGIQPALRLAGARLDGESLPIGEPAAVDETPQATPGSTTTTDAPVPESPDGRAQPLMKRDLGQLEYVGILRFWSIYRLTLPSAVLDPCRDARAEGNPQDYSFDLAIEWPGAASGASEFTDKEAVAVNPPVGPESGPDRWRKLASRLVVNPKALDRYRQASPALYNGAQVTVTDPHLLWPGKRLWARMPISRDGLYRLDPDELIKAGFPSEQVRIEDVRIFTHGESVPLMIPPVEGLPDWFEPGVYFVGRQGQSEYSANQVYWVTLGSDLPRVGLPLQPPPVDVSGAELNPLVRMTATLDRDNSLQRMHDNFQSIRGMHWVDAPLTTEEPFPFGLTLPDLDSDSVQSLDVILNFFISETLPFSSTRVEVLVGGEVIDRLQFYHTRDLQKRVQVPVSAFQDDQTTITLRMTQSVASLAEEQALWFDRAEVVYPGRPKLLDQHLVLEPWMSEEKLGLTSLPVGDSLPALALDTDDKGKPLALHPFDGSGIYWNTSKRSRVEIWTHSAVSMTPPLEPVEYDDLIDETQGADYLIITHPEFRQEAERLAEYRRAGGWRVRVTDIQNVYDAFSNGEQDPRAIRDLLAYSLLHWKAGVPDCVLLVGDCTNDYLNVARSNDVRNWVPTYTYTVGSDHWASDYWLTTVAGEDDLGDFMIGRLSVANRTDATTIVDKIIEYDEHPRFGPWRARLGYVADNGEFADTIREIRRDDTPPAFDSGQMFLDEQPLEDNWYLPQEYVERKGMKVSREATAGILGLFREGVSYLTYYGHGSPNIWSDERIWFGGDSPNSDNQHLADSGYYTFVSNMTCNTGTIDYPMPPWNICITEDLMRVSGGGAIACFVPSGPGVTSIHRHMSDQLRQVMFQDDHVRSLGEMTTLARLRYALNLFPRDLLYMYLLLGDPALDLQMTSQWITFDLPQPVLSPGGVIDCVLTGLEPSVGTWIAQLVDENEKAIWKSGAPRPYATGRLPLNITLPESVGPGGLTLRLYAWNPQTGKDLALGTRMQIEQPLIKLTRVEPLAEGGAFAELVNDGKLPAKATLTLNLLTGKDSRELVRQDVKVPAGSSREITLLAPDGDIALRVGSAFEVVLERLSDPVDWSLGRRETKTIPSMAVPEQACWVVPMCRLEMKNNSQRADLRLTAVSASGSGEDDELWARLLDTNGNVVTSRTLTLVDVGLYSIGEGMIPLSPSQIEQLKGGRLSLSQPDGQEQDRLDMDNLACWESRLRIVPESIVQRPENPTEGETVFIDFTVENNGSLSAGEASVALLDNYMDEDGQLLENEQKTGWVKIPALGPGRNYPLSLRWDPLHNAGEKRIFIQLVSGPGMISNDDADQTRIIAVNARTKPDLSITRVWNRANEAETGRHQITFHAEIRNDGQTDAQRVLVTFFRSNILTPQNVLGEVEVETVPGESTVQADFVWTYDPARDMGAGMTLPRPMVQLRLKGSSQRITSAGEVASE